MKLEKSIQAALLSCVLMIPLNLNKVGAMQDSEILTRTDLLRLKDGKVPTIKKIITVNKENINLFKDQWTQIKPGDQVQCKASIESKDTMQVKVECTFKNVKKIVE